eukprot:COSAG05_NODE_1181_length_5596_cov_3.093687_7_plen_94_part_00
MRKEAGRWVQNANDEARAARAATAAAEAALEAWKQRTGEKITQAVPFLPISCAKKSRAPYVCPPSFVELTGIYHMSRDYFREHRRERHDSRSR